MMITNRFLIVIFVLCVLSIDNVFSQPATVLTKNGNIFSEDAAGKQTQLTATSKDTMPVLSFDKKYIAFVRKTDGPKNEKNDFDSSQIWLLNLKSRKSYLLVQSMPDSDIYTSTLRGNFDALQFSVDEKYLYFLSGAWATSKAVHRVNLYTRDDEFITEGNSLYVIPTGKNAGCLMVAKHKLKEGGGYSNDNWLLTPTGEEIKDIGLYEKQMKLQ